MVVEPVAPRAMASAEGVAVSVKPGAACTVTVMGMLCVTPPPVAVTVNAYVPVTAAELALTAMADVPVPVMDAGLKLAVTPAGKPLAARLVAELYP